ncbi:acyltransferase [Rickettsiaceae bacterium]|nr:acyltransferase [Rickettsiaceae bacterium]
MTVTTFEYTKIINKENITFGNNVIIDDFVLIYAKTKMSIGSYTHIGSFSSIVASTYVEMQDFSGLSQGCRIFSGSDDFSGGGFGNPSINEKYRNITKAPVILEKFSIIGANSVILPGVTIGEGASVSAGSVISKDLDPWGVYINNRKIKDRDQKGVMENYNKFCLENKL